MMTWIIDIVVEIGVSRQIKDILEGDLNSTWK